MRFLNANKNFIHEISSMFSVSSNQLNNFDYAKKRRPKDAFYFCNRRTCAFIQILKELITFLLRQE